MRAGEQLAGDEQGLLPGLEQPQARDEALDGTADADTRRGRSPSLQLSLPLLIHFVSRQRARYMPDIRGIALKGKDAVHSTDLMRGKVSLVAFESTRMAAVSRQPMTSLSRR